MEPTSTEIQTLGLDASVMAIAIWAGFDQAGVNMYFDLLGFEVDPTAHPRLLAILSKEQHQKLMEDWEINGENVKPVVIMTAMLVH